MGTKIALAGNPNCGKTTLFNILTGSTAYVGNWAGVTVDKREGTYKSSLGKATITDLPGIYSLSPYSPEEVVAGNYILSTEPDVIINIVDVTNLERNLYLSTQILESDVPVVIALNMTDVLEKNKGNVNEKELEKEIGVPVVSISALQGKNIDKLMELAFEASKKPRKGYSVLKDSVLSEKFDIISKLLGDTDSVAYKSVKLLEGDKEVSSKISPEILKSVEEIKKDSKVIEENFDNDYETAIADARYSYIEKHFKKTYFLGETESSEGLTKSDKIDRLLTHGVWGIPMFLLFMFTIFHLTFGSNLLFFTGLETPGVFLQSQLGNLMGVIIDAISNLLISAGANDIVHGMIVDGILAGLDGVLSFLPQIALLFLFLSFMEDSGYMARGAFIMDRLFRRFGLSGKSFMPLLMGFGCSVPAIMATKTLENDRDRRITIMIIVGFSCGAKLPIWSLFAMAFFPNHADLMVFGIYILGIVVAMLAAFILKKTVFKGEAAHFIMELPTYHLPKLKNLLLHVWEKVKGYIIRAGTIIAASAVVIWFLSNFNFSFQQVDANSSESIMGVLASFLVPVFKPLGWASGPNGWKAIVATLTGLIAKEMVVSTMGVLYNPAVEGDALEDEGTMTALIPVILSMFSLPAALSFMAFNLLSVPCMAAVAAAKAELGNAKWFWSTIAFWVFLAYVVSFLIYNIGTLIGL